VINDVLGSGAFAEVRKAINRKTGEMAAVKIIDKSGISGDDEEQLMMELDILATVDHPSVVKLLEIFDDGNRFYLILEYMGGGELFDRIVEKEHYSENEAR
jgi:calcium/calmodulin-dependent protein kinase I